MQDTLTHTFYDEMERFLSLAREKGVERIVIDCRTRRVELDYSQTGRRDGVTAVTADSTASSYAEQYLVMQAKFMEWEKCEQELQRLKDKAVTDVTRAQLRHLIGEQLGRLLKGNFIRTEDWFCDEEQLAVAVELDEWMVPREGAEQKYAFLRQMITLREDSLTVNEQAVGKYLFTRSDTLAPRDVAQFFRFVGVCEVVLPEIRNLIQSESGDTWAALEERLSTLFYTDEQGRRALSDFMLFLQKSPKPGDITREVKRLVEGKAVSDASCKKPFYDMLHDADVYTLSYESWRRSV